MTKLCHLYLALVLFEILEIQTEEREYNENYPLLKKTLKPTTVSDVFSLNILLVTSTVGIYPTHILIPYFF